jgi:alpha-L-fucosidase
MKNRTTLLFVILSIIISCTPEQGQRKNIKAEGKYQPNLQSVRSHACPEWFKDAKFGMFIDWGVYSVPGWAPKKDSGAMYPDWYLHVMHHNPTVKKYHRMYKNI